MTTTTTPNDVATQPVLDVVAILAALQDQLDDLTATVRAQQARIHHLAAALQHKER